VTSRLTLLTATLVLPLLAGCAQVVAEAVIAHGIREGANAFDRAYDASLSFETSALPAARVGTRYTATLIARGEPPQPYRWRLIGGRLPPGLVLDPASGSLHGTPTAAGEASLVVEVSSPRPNVRGETGSRPFIRSRARRLTIAVLEPTASETPDGGDAGSRSP
jgi:hypothetical protein